jgi:Ca2+/Na+ antiporter
MGLSMLLWVNWATTIYELKTTHFVTEGDIFRAPHPLGSTFVILSIFLVLLWVLNRGSERAIISFNIIFDVIFYFYLLSIIIFLIMSIFVSVSNLGTVLFFLLFLPFGFYLRSIRKNCRWLDLTSSPEEWELPAALNHRERVLAARGIELPPRVGGSSREKVSAEVLRATGWNGPADAGFIVLLIVAFVIIAVILIFLGAALSA